MVCSRYRPRQPHASPVWQVLRDHAAKLPGLSADAAGTIDAFLDCGDLHAGFIRFRCPDCDHELGFRPTRKPEDFDQTGFELPPAPVQTAGDHRQSELFADDYAQPDAVVAEPVFWPDGGGQAFPDDDFVQVDAAESI